MLPIVYILIMCYKYFMRFTKKPFLLFLFFILKSALFCEDYLIEELSNYFNAMNWSQANNVIVPNISEPFTLNETDSNSVFVYADTLKDDSVFPEIEGLGILDYSGIDGSLVNFFNNICLAIKEKKLNSEICTEERPFLPYLFEYRFKRLESVKTIEAVFFARPSFTGKNRAKTDIRFNYIQNGKPVYRIMTVEALKKEAGWFVEAFDFIGDENAVTSKQN